MTICGAVFECLSGSNLEKDLLNMREVCLCDLAVVQRYVCAYNGPFNYSLLLVPSYTQVKDKSH